MSNNNRNTFREASNADLGEMIEHCRLNRGAAAELRRRFNALAGREVSAQQFARWIEPDPRRRTEPRHGAGVMLKTVWTKYHLEINLPL